MASIIHLKTLQEPVAVSKALGFILALFSAITCYIAFTSYVEIKNYEVYLNQMSDKISLTNAQLMGAEEEIRILNNRIDNQNKSLTKLQEDNRIQEVLINEARAKRRK
jgi:peptidoglycan hydrolase CwlO-like protein